MGLMVKILGDGSGFQATLDKLETQAGGFGKSLNAKMTGNFSEAIMGIVPGLTGAIAGIFSADAIKEQLRAFSEMGEKIHFGAIRMNIDETQFQRIQNVLEYTKTDIGSVETAFDKLAEGMTKIERGDKEAAQLQQSLAYLGVTADDLKSKNYQDIFFQIAAGMKGIEPSKEQIAALRDIFGRGGDNLLPAFSLGFDSKFANGGILDKGALDSIELLNRSTREADATMKGFWNRAKEGATDFHTAMGMFTPGFWKHRLFDEKDIEELNPYNARRLAEIAAAKEKEKADARAAQAQRESEQKNVDKKLADDAKRARDIDKDTAAIKERDRLANLTPEQRTEELKKTIKSAQGELDYGENTSVEAALLRKKIAESQSEIDRIAREKPKKEHEMHHELMRLGNAGIGGIMLSHGGDEWKKHAAETAKHVASIDKKTKQAMPGHANRDYH